MIFFILNGLFTLAWFIYGGVVLFTDNGPGFACVSTFYLINSEHTTHNVIEA